MISISDIKWTAGFLEGEGHFSANIPGRSVAVTATQVQKWPLDKLNSIFHGKIYFVHKRENRQESWRWDLTSSKAIALMMTLYVLMSPNKKEQIIRCINFWKGMNPNPHSPFCKRGHKRIPENTYVNPKTGFKYCKICMYLKRKNLV